MLIMQNLLTFRNTALLTAAVETSLSVYISPQFPQHCYKTHQFFLFVFPLPIYYIIVDLTLRKSTSGTNYCSLAEVAESPASQQ